MTKQELQQLAKQWPKGKPLMLPSIIEDAYQDGAVKMLQLIHQHLTERSKPYFSNSSTPEVLEGVVKHIVDKELAPFITLLP